MSFWQLHDLIFAVVPDLGEIDVRLFAAIILLMVVIPAWLSWEQRRS